MDLEVVRRKIEKYTIKLSNSKNRDAMKYHSKLTNWHKKYAEIQGINWDDMKKDAQYLIFSGSL